LLTKWSGVDNVNGEPVTRETLFHDYREVGGLKFAFELVSNTPGADVTQRIVVDKIELDAQIEDSHFSKPSASPASPAAASTPPPPPSPAKQSINALQLDAKDVGGTGQRRSTSLR
jgi:hypothetical protein